MAITVGCDVQRDRLEVTLAGWTEAGECLVLSHAVLWGSPHDEQTWRDLDALLTTKWDHPFGGKIGIDAAVIDSGDGETMERSMPSAFRGSAARS